MGGQGHKVKMSSEQKAVSSKNAKLTDRALSAIHAAVYFLCGMLLSQGLYAALFLALCSMLLAPCSSVQAQPSRTGSDWLPGILFELDWRRERPRRRAAQARMDRGSESGDRPALLGESCRSTPRPSRRAGSSQGGHHCDKHRDCSSGR